MNSVIVFGGWAVPPGILKGVFGDSARYIDVNRIMPELFDADRLRADWIDTVIARCQLTTDSPPEILAGWSTGAMFAFAAARVCCPRKLTLLSATPCFCRRDDFRSGTRPQVIDRMISALGQDKGAVLQSFHGQCGLPYDSTEIPDYTFDELRRGLMFLKQADLRPLAPLSIRPLFCHGRDDQIIPASASAYFSERVGGVHYIFDGGHTFFYTQPAAINYL